MFCMTCGKELPNEARFCMTCGAAQSDAAPPSPPSPAAAAANCFAPAVPPLDADFPARPAPVNKLTILHTFNWQGVCPTCDLVHTSETCSCPNDGSPLVIAFEGRKPNDVANTPTWAAHFRCLRDCGFKGTTITCNRDGSHIMGRNIQFRYPERFVKVQRRCRRFFRTIQLLAFLVAGPYLAYSAYNYHMFMEHEYQDPTARFMKVLDGTLSQSLGGAKNAFEANEEFVEKQKTHHNELVLQIIYGILGMGGVLFLGGLASVYKAKAKYDFTDVARAAKAHAKAEAIADAVETAKATSAATRRAFEK